MPATMSKRKANGPARRGGKATSPREAFHLPTDLKDALRRYVESTKPKPDKSEVMRLALTEYLERVGFWPPPAAGQPEE